jgi:hypothetical protein
LNQKLLPQSSFDLLRQALDGLLPAARSHSYRAGFLGEILRGSGQTLLASELTHLILPGLATLGVTGVFAPFLKDGTDLIEPEKSGAAILLFGFEGPLEFAPPDEIHDATPLPEKTDPKITAQALFLPSGSKFSPRTYEEAFGEPAETLRLRFSHALFLSRSHTKTRRHDSIVALLHRWLAWHAAYPTRAPQEGDVMDPACSLTAAFLLEIAGTRRDYVSNRLRYAARHFEAAEIEAAYAWLLEAAIAGWQLPAAAAEALLASPDHPMPDLLRRELIYFARAGILPLKTLAARRLTRERHHPDAAKTLHQLRFDPDPWVRAAAERT